MHSKKQKHAFIVKHTMWGIVVRHVGDNGESTGRVGSWKVKGAEQRENIQFNFETASAQSTNTKASLQPYPCWRLELIHCLQARAGGRENGGRRKGRGGDKGSNKEISREKMWVDAGKKTKKKKEKEENWRKYPAAVSLLWRRRSSIPQAPRRAY